MSRRNGNLRSRMSATLKKLSDLKHEVQYGETQSQIQNRVESLTSRIAQLEHDIHDLLTATPPATATESNASHGMTRRLSFRAASLKLKRPSHEDVLADLKSSSPAQTASQAAISASSKANDAVDAIETQTNGSLAPTSHQQPSSLSSDPPTPTLSKVNRPSTNSINDEASTMETKSLTKHNSVHDMIVGAGQRENGSRLSEIDIDLDVSNPFDDDASTNASLNNSHSEVTSLGSHTAAASEESVTETVVHHASTVMTSSSATAALVLSTAEATHPSSIANSPATAPLPTGSAPRETSLSAADADSNDGNTVNGAASLQDETAAPAATAAAASANATEDTEAAIQGKEASIAAVESAPPTPGSVVAASHSSSPLARVASVPEAELSNGHGGPNNHTGQNGHAANTAASSNASSATSSPEKPPTTGADEDALDPVQLLMAAMNGSAAMADSSSPSSDVSQVDRDEEEDIPAPPPDGERRGSMHRLFHSPSGSSTGSLEDLASRVAKLHAGSPSKGSPLAGSPRDSPVPKRSSLATIDFSPVVKVKRQPSKAADLEDEEPEDEEINRLMPSVA
eukprot:TRINITY_DN24072_c0_g1_i1.p1 TRINITY_DN24072_c0_g1~~TRINITY_DN24072_c0_g1_i1.p1  ORF type:complete len:571 (+),score=141.97 TRINITY_DN24072_c0_g1_i1:216-1928(+)